MALRRLLVLALITVSVEAQTRPSTDSIYQAIRNDDLATLSALGRDGASLKDDQGQTPLMWASALGSVAAMRILLGAGADPKVATATGLTALHLAATNAAKTRLLLDAGADLNAVSPLGRTPLLIAAAANESADAARLLIERGANVNILDNAGLTPLGAAAMVDNEAVVRLLLARGADVAKAKATAGGPPAEPLMGAAASGNLELVRTLLSKGADVNAMTGPAAGRVKNGNVQFGNLSPLHFGVVGGNTAIVSALLVAGAEVNAKDARGMTPLMFAIATDRPNRQVVQVLLDKGADPAIKSKVDETSLAWANKFQQPDVLAALKISSSHAAVAVRRDVAQRDQTARAAVERSLPLLQTGSRRTMSDGGCVACHGQPLTGLASQLAQSRGWTVPASDDLAQVQTDLNTSALPLLQLRDGGGLPDGVLYDALLLAAEQIPANRGTDALVYYLAAKQRTAGNWKGVGATRAPIQDGDFSRTALAIRALRVYGVPAQSRDTAARVARASQWLAAQNPLSTEDRIMQLLGLRWANEAASVRDRRLRELLALQRADGGWAQTQHLESDAYATGQVLYTLRQLEVPARDARLQRAVAFLLRTQQDDGSWHVTNRAMKIQPYFESGFPYGHDQWISQAGTAWAAMALTVADAEPPATTRATR